MLRRALTTTFVFVWCAAVASAQDVAQLEEIRIEQTQTSEVVESQLRQYLMNRVTPLPNSIDHPIDRKT